jgi:hypothetical protein
VATDPAELQRAALLLPKMRYGPSREQLKELIALAKSKPGEILYASTGVGTAPHLAAELFSVRAGVKLVYVPYQGRSAGGYRSAGRAHRRHVLAGRTKSRKLRLKPRIRA